MRKFFTLLFAVVALCANAQFSPSEISSHLKQVSRANVPVRHITLDPNRSVSNIAIDYDSFDVKWQHQHTPPDTMHYFSWNINKNNLNTSNFSLRYAVQTYDTLIDVNNNFAGTAKAGTTVTVDSFDLILAHSNQSGLNDTFMVSVFDKSTATVTGVGVNSALNTTALWSDTIIVNQNFFPTDSLFYLATFMPHLTLPAGHVAGIRIDFKGDTLDQLYVLASYRDHCGSAGLGDTNKIAPRNSSFYWNYGANSSFANWSTNLAFTSSTTCKYFFIQNFLFYPYLTLNTASGVTPATVVTNAATGVTSTGATLNGSVNANGNSTVATFDWGLTTSYGSSAAATPSPVTGSSATPIIANLSGLTPNTTYHFRAKGVNGGGTSNGVDLTFTTTGGSVCTPDAGITSGLGPVSSNVPCIQQGVAYSQTYTFVVPTTAAGGAVTVTSVTFDSIRNLPTGLTAAFSQTPATYAGGTTGCFLVSGTTNAACGQYQMLVYVTIVTNALTVNGELSALATQYSIPGFPKNFLRVIGQGGTCPAVNASQSTTFAAGSCGTTTSITSTATKTDVSCFGGNNGTATAVPSGGTTYTYAWSNSGTTATISNLTAGNYTVTVTDAGGGTATASVTVGQPSSAVGANASATQTTCGASTGSATVTPSGGTPNYTYHWSNNGNTATISSLGSGNFTVTVTDSKGCSATAATSVTAPGGPSGSASTSNVNCFGSSTGGVTVTETGGTGTITYHWSNNANTQNLTNVAAGTYTLTITDANNCSFSLSATVNQPSASVTVTGTVTNATSGNNGGVNITAVGGTGSYTYSWSNSANTEDLHSLGAGTYTVTVTDQNSCTGTASFTVTSNVGITGLELVSKFTVFPNPASSEVNVQITLTDNTDVRIELLDLNGRVMLSENAGNVKQLNYKLNTSAVPNGIYVIHVVGSKLNAEKQLTITK